MSRHAVSNRFGCGNLTQPHLPHLPHFPLGSTFTRHHTFVIRDCLVCIVHDSLSIPTCPSFCVLHLNSNISTQTLVGDEADKHVQNLTSRLDSIYADTHADAKPGEKHVTSSQQNPTDSAALRRTWSPRTNPHSAINRPQSALERADMVLANHRMRKSEETSNGCCFTSPNGLAYSLTVSLPLTNCNH